MPCYKAENFFELIRQEEAINERGSSAYGRTPSENRSKFPGRHPGQATFGFFRNSASISPWFALIASNKASYVGSFATIRCLTSSS
jgi:hypothetical protein